MKKEHICDIKEPFKLYRIGMFASMNHVTVKTLRYYDEQGLLKPVSVDTATGYRYYTAGQLPVIHQILVLRNMGFSLEEIKGIQRGESEEELLRAKKRQLLAEIAEKSKFELVGDPVEMKQAMKEITYQQCENLARAMAGRLKKDRV